MDTLSFVVELVKAGAWPAALIVAILLLRRPLTGLLPLLEELKYKDISLKFREKLSEAKASLPSASSEKSALPVPDDQEQGMLLQLARWAPRAAVTEAWRRLEDAILVLSVSRGQIPSKEVARNHSRLGIAMQAIGVFSEADEVAFRKLRELRNQAAHGPEFALSEADAEEYIRLVGSLLGKVRSR